MDKFLSALVYGVGVTFLYAFVLWQLWGWFVEPLGLPAISYAHAVGLSMFGQWLATMVAMLPKDGPNVSWHARATKVVALLIVWGVGAAAHAAMP